MLIRNAERKDLQDILRLFFNIVEESPRYSSIAISKDVLLNRIKWLIQSPKGLLLVAEDGEEVIGMFWASIDTFFFSDVQVANELLIYVTPKHRKGFVAYRLLKQFESWARSLNIDHIQGGVSTCIDNSGIENFYNRMGYNTTGVLLSKEL
jgi:GNAT superfamily N-acetyltransferase